jgi:hypothetical protein
MIASTLSETCRLVPQSVTTTISLGTCRLVPRLTYVLQSFKERVDRYRINLPSLQSFKEHTDRYSDQHTIISILQGTCRQVRRSTYRHFSPSRNMSTGTTINIQSLQSFKERVDMYPDQPTITSILQGTCRQVPPINLPSLQSL